MTSWYLEFFIVSMGTSRLLAFYETEKAAKKKYALRMVGTLLIFFSALFIGAITFENFRLHCCTLSAIGLK